MKNQIQKIIQEYNLTLGKLAERISVQASSLSHILSGRNNPSYSFIIKILSAFPEIDPDWLLTGDGSMFREAKTADKIIPTHDINDTHNHQSETIELTLDLEGNSDDLLKEQKDTVVEDKIAISNEECIVDKQINRVEAPNIQGDTKIEQILVFYSDSTFKQYNSR